MTPALRTSRFTEYFIQANGLEKDHFKVWVLYPGMLFNASVMWWGDGAKRHHPHEGLDLCCYRDGRDRIVGLDEKTRIPAMFDGVIVGMIDDFIGKSLILKHHTPGDDGGEFCTIYGHTDPESDMHIGRIVEEGQVVARVADAKRSDASPHLHLSIGLVSKAISYDRLDWKTIADPATMTLIDPILVIDRTFLVSGLV